MSQAGIIDMTGVNPQLLTSVDSDSGTAIPLNNNLEIVGDGGAISTSGSGKTLTISFGLSGEPTIPTSIVTDSGTATPSTNSLTIVGGTGLGTTGSSSTLTISIDDECDLGEITSFEIPNSATPSLDSDGEIAVDTSVTDFSTGILKYYGGEEMGVVAMPILQFSSPTDGYIVAYNATNDEFELVVQSGGGDVSKVGTPVDNQIGVWTGDGTIEGTAGFTFDGSDLVLYEAVNDGNPTFSIGSSATEALKITSSYFSGSQSLQTVNFETFTASASANRGIYKFYVDGSILLDIEDDGINVYGDVVASNTFIIGATEVLSSTTLGTGVVNSSLTSVGTIATGTWQGTTIAVDQGGTGQTTYTDGQLLIGNSTGNTLDKATLSGTTNEVDVTNGSGSITLSLSDTVDLGGHSSFEIPNSATPTVNADGEIAIDTTVADFSHGVFKYYGGEEMGVVAMPIAQFTSPTDGYVVAYNATNDEFELVSSGAGDVTAGANLTDNAIIRGDGGVKGVQDSGVSIDDSDNITGVVSLTMGGNLTNYEASNDANPEILLGSSDAEELHIQSVYDGAAQTLDYVLFQTDVASATANKGLYRFNVDGTDILDIDDGGIDLDSGMALSIAGTDVLNATTLGSGVTASSLTSVGTISSGTWQGTAIAVDQGGTGQTSYTDGQLLIGNSTGNTLDKATLSGTTNEIDIANGSGSITLSLSDTVDLGGHSSFEIPNSATPTVNADGEIAIDTTVTDFSHGVFKYYGGEEMGIVAMPIAQFTSPTDAYVVAYNATNDEFELVAQSGGGDVSKVGTPVDNQIGVWTGDGTIEGTADFTFDGADLLFYNAVNDGNPEIRLGATDAEELHIQSVFDSGAQTLDYVLFQTDAASATSHKGKYRFNVDGTNILDIRDDGLVVTGVGAGNVYADSFYTTSLQTQLTNGQLNVTGGMVISSTAVLQLEGDTNVIAKLGDNAGAISFIVQDSDTANVASIDSDGNTVVTTLTTSGNIEVFEATNDGNPELRIGSSTAEELHIQSVYDGGAQTLDYVLFQTDVASATANKGLYRFNVDGTDILDIDDGGIDLDSGKAISVAGTDILSATTLGSGVTASSLTSVGTIATGTWEGTTIAVDQGGTGQTSYTDGQLLIGNTTGNTLAKATLTGTANEIDITNGSGSITLALSDTIDLGGHSSFEIPNSATPTVNADGEIAIDTTVTDFSHGILKYYGGEEMAVVALPIAELTSPTDTHVVTYNATNDEFELAAGGSGSMPEAVFGGTAAAHSVNTTTSFAPLEYVDQGTVESVVRAFDDTTEEYMQGWFRCPADLDASGTITFEVHGMAKTVHASNNLVKFTLGHRAVADSEAIDGVYTDEDSGDLTTDATQDDLDIFTWTETVSNAAWTAGDLIHYRFSRIDASATELSGDYYVYAFYIRVPRA